MLADPVRFQNSVNFGVRGTRLPRGRTTRRADQGGRSGYAGAGPEKDGER